MNDVSDAILESADQVNPPIRLTIGNVANTNVEAALRERLEWLGSN